MLEQAVPMFLKENAAFIRDEADGYLTMMSNRFPGGIKLLNRTANEIAELCNGALSVHEIQRQMIAKYTDVKANTIKKDVAETLVILGKSGYIEWKDDFDPFAVTPDLFEIRLDKHTRTLRATENDFAAIKDFVTGCGYTTGDKADDYMMLSGSRAKLANMYEEISLRARLFGYQEWFYFLERKGEKTGLVSILDEFPHSTRAMVSVLGLKNGHDLCDDIAHLLAIVCLDRKNQNHKIKVNLLSTVERLEECKDGLQRQGFILEGTFKDEYKKGEDELQFAKILQ